MRFIPAACLVPGMVTAKDLYGSDNKLMLRAGNVLSKTEIDRINYLSFQGIYIHDELSRDIEVTDIINVKLKNDTIKAIKDIHLQAENIKVNSSGLNLKILERLLDNIISEITDNRNAIINMFDLKTFDDYTYQHSVSVAVIAIVMGMSMNYSQTRLYELGLGALLHDVGKIFIPIEILDKKGKLTDEEYEIVKTHSLLGSNYLRERWIVPLESNLAVLNHHERYDGTGYPHRLKGNKISEYGRVLSICDVYDALTSDRCYRKAFLPSEAMEFVMGGCGTMFDPDLVTVFSRRVVPYPNGTIVKLSNGLSGIVMENYSNYCMRPKVKIINDQNQDVIFDLCNDTSLLGVTIVDVVKNM